MDDTLVNPFEERRKTPNRDVCKENPNARLTFGLITWGTSPHSLYERCAMSDERVGPRNDTLCGVNELDWRSAGAPWHSGCTRSV